MCSTVTSSVQAGAEVSLVLAPPALPGSKMYLTNACMPVVCLIRRFQVIRHVTKIGILERLGGLQCSHLRHM
jgi:hypothetical protein